MIDWAQWMVGDIARVSAQLATFVERPGVEGKVLDPANDSALLLLEFGNGAQGTIHASTVAHMGERSMYLQIVLHGEAGTLEIDSSFVGTEIRGARHDEEQIRSLPIPDRFLAGVDPESPPLIQFGQVFTKQSAGSRFFIDCIIEDRPVIPNFHDGLKVQEVIDAAMEADQQECWVSLP